jgi:hypothetical protein
MSEPEKPWTWGDRPPQPAKHPVDLHPEGTRFLATGYDADMHVFGQGDWVRYTDYAKLQELVGRMDSTINESQAECRRLKEENEKYRRCFQGERDWVLMEPGEHARLEAQVERLTKAGDSLVWAFEKGSHQTKADAINVWIDIKAWNAAKEGKQS